MSVLLKRGLPKDTIGVELPNGLDGQGVQSYQASTNIDGYYTETDEVVFNDDGEQERVTLKVWVDADESTIPTRKSRLTIDGTTYIVKTRKENKRLLAGGGAVDHYKLMCREEE